MDSGKQHQTLFWFLNLNITKAIFILLIGCLVFLPISGFTYYKQEQKKLAQSQQAFATPRLLASNITEYCNPIQEGYGASGYTWAKVRICLLYDDNALNTWSARVYVLDTQYKYGVSWHWPSTKYPYHASITIADGKYINAQSPVKIIYGPTDLTGPEGASAHINTLTADKWLHANDFPFTWSIIYRQSGPYWPASDGIIQIIGHFPVAFDPRYEEFCDSWREIYSPKGDIKGTLQMCLQRNKSTGKWRPKISVVSPQYKLNSSWHLPSAQAPYDSILLIQEVVAGKPGKTIYGPVVQRDNTYFHSTFTAPEWTAGSSNTFSWRIIYNQAGPYWPPAHDMLQYYPTFTVTDNKHVQISTAP